MGFVSKERNFDMVGLGCGCCLGVILLAFAPRIALIVMYFMDYLAVYETRLWPFLGFFLMPCTTIGYCVSMNELGSVSDWGLVLVIICIVLDLGAASGTTANAAKPKKTTNITIDPRMLNQMIDRTRETRDMIDKQIKKDFHK